MAEPAAEAAAEAEEDLEIFNQHAPLPASMLGPNTPSGKRVRGKPSSLWTLCKRLRCEIPQHLALRLQGKTHVCVVPLDDGEGFCNFSLRLSRKPTGEWLTSHAIEHFRAEHPETETGRQSTQRKQGNERAPSRDHKPGPRPAAARPRKSFW